MDVTITYDGRPRVLSFGESVSVDEFRPRTAQRPVDADSFRQSLEAAGGKAWVDGARALIVVNDGFRSTPTPTILDWLDAIDPQLLDRACFLVATGTHEYPADAHWPKIFGRHCDRVRDRVTVHSATETTLMAAVGRDRLGGEVLLNSTILEASQAIFISSVEPHYFAGFTGGRKSLFPGLCDLATIERNHNLANSVDAQPMRLAGNPLAEHLDELTALVDTSRFFGIQVVLDAAHNIASLHCGSLGDSFLGATESARYFFGNQVSQPYDLVIAEVRPPLDANLYQIQKALENCQAGVKDGGTIVLASACREGVGSAHFFDLAQTWDRETNKPRGGGLKFGSHKLSRVISHGRRIRILVDSLVPANEVRQVFYEPLDNLEEFLFISRRNLPDLRPAVVHDAGNTVLSI
ncbi:MAG: lactate racemase domain-containing protein [bacterium]